MQSKRVDEWFREYCRRRDPALLARVFDATAPGLLALARHLRARRDDAEDLLQVTFLRVIEVADQFRGDGTFVAWAGAILANEARARQRRAQRREQSEARHCGAAQDRSSVDWDDAVAAAPGGPAPEQDVLHEELRARVESALRGIDGRYGDVLRMRMFEGLSGVEIAARLGRPPRTVRSQLARGMRRLFVSLGSLARQPLRLAAAWLGLGPLAATRREVLRRAAQEFVGRTGAGAASGAVGSVVGVAVSRRTALAALAVCGLTIGGLSLAGGTANGAPHVGPTGVPIVDRVASAHAPVPADRMLAVAPGVERTLVTGPGEAASAGAWELVGRVVRVGDGGPVDDCLVRVEVLHGKDVAAVVDGRTDAAGDYRIDVAAIASRGEVGWLDAGLVVHFDAPAHHPVDRVLLAERDLAPHRSGRGMTARADVELEAGACAVGELLDADGRPFVGHCVARCGDAAPTVLEGADLLEGRFRVALPRTRAAWLTVEFESDLGVLSARVPVPRGDQDVLLGALRWPRGGELTARLVDRLGAPVPFQSVRLELAQADPGATAHGRIGWGCRTDRRGTFFCGGMRPGRYVVLVDGEFAFVESVLELHTDAPLRDLVVDGVPLTIETRDARSGELLPCAGVRLCRVDGAHAMLTLGNASECAGCFDVRVPHGARFTVEVDDWRLLGEPVAVDADAQRAAVLVVPVRWPDASQSGLLRLDVRDQLGRAVAPADYEVELLPASPGRGDACRLAGAALQHTPLPVGEYLVGVTPSDDAGSATWCARSDLRLHVARGGAAAPERVEVRSGAAVRVRVQAPPGATRDVWLQVRSADGSFTPLGFVDRHRDGDAAIEWCTVPLPAGRHTLRAVCGDIVTAAAEVDVRPGAGASVELRW